MLKTIMQIDSCLCPYHVLYICNCVQRAVPYGLVTCRKLSKSVYRLL